MSQSFLSPDRRYLPLILFTSDCHVSRYRRHSQGRMIRRRILPGVRYPIARQRQLS